MEPSSNRRRLYQVWKGSNRFACGGRLIFGPDVGSIFLSMILITGPLIALCCQVITKITKTDASGQTNLSGNHILGLPVLIVTVLLGIADLTFLLLTSSRDPGIVPRNSRPPEAEEVFDAASASTEWVNAASPHLRLPRTKDVIVNGYTVKVKYCDTCLLYRPPRTSHCSICNNCVQKFDHHCPWVGQCIGLRNYRFFYMFISTSTFLCFYVFILSWLNIIKERSNYHNSILKSMSGEVLSLILIVYTFIAVWFVGGLTVFHTYLMSTNQTTYENFRYRYDKKENPYNKGVLRNVREVFFSKMPPSLNNFRSWVTEEMPEIVPITPHTAAAINNVATKEKLDLELGYKGGIAPNIPHIPTILQGLDYSAIENNLNLKEREMDQPEPFVFSSTPPRDNLESHESDEGYRKEQQSVSFHVEVEEKAAPALPHQNHAMQ
ncbi:hypothetical protein LUZ61_013744 [Rhynchospora tenuis]|uniref:S-acyltransferase n=1 Tax=Rhynchospora tenuis TaxID=198213 RepID=A0AAD5W9B8_9POAL|nr:hypothetical protein LUZ61_013744 [Rhynchospora tenuis]